MSSTPPYFAPVDNFRRTSRVLFRRTFRRHSWHLAPALGLLKRTIALPHLQLSSYLLMRACSPPEELVSRFLATSVETVAVGALEGVELVFREVGQPYPDSLRRLSDLLREPAYERSAAAYWLAAPLHELIPSEQVCGRFYVIHMHSIPRSGTGYDEGMWKNPFNKSGNENEESKEELDAMAESARREIEDLRKSKQLEEEADMAIQAAQNLAQQNMAPLQNPPIFYGIQGMGTATSTVRANGIGGAGGTMQWSEYGNIAIDQHHNSGVCQDSYDKGYEDGLLAGKAGDDSRT